MNWDEPSDWFAQELAWVRQKVDADIAPLDHVLVDPVDVGDPLRAELIPPLQDEVKSRGLWALHLDRARWADGAPEQPRKLDQPCGQVEFAMLNEVLGRSHTAPVVFGCQAPDASNMEILYQFGTPEQREEFFEPLAAGSVVSSFSVTEPEGGADPTGSRTVAVSDGDDWVIHGAKWFSSNFSVAEFALVLAVTDPSASRHQRLTMFIVPTGASGVEVLRRVRSAGTHHAIHDHVLYNGVRVPAPNVLGEVGGGFAVMANRMGSARLSLAARTLGQLNIAFEAMCERALSRHSGSGVLADRQLVQQMIAESWMSIEQYRLLLFRTASRLDSAQNVGDVRADIAAVKAIMPRVAHEVATRAAHLHGSLGASFDMPFLDMIGRSVSLGIADGPTEIHVTTLARDILRNFRPCESDVPATHVPTAEAAARDRFAEAIERHRATSTSGGG